MSILPVAVRRRLRASGFSEPQTDALDEASEATAVAARVGLAKHDDVRDEYHALRRDIDDNSRELALLRGEMQAMKWWLFGTLSLTILSATAAIIAAMVFLG